MTLEDLTKEYNRLQSEYGDPTLDSIHNGGCTNHPDICFVFMNPTGRNIASSKEWKGRKSPWIGTKNIWTLFHSLGLVDEEIYQTIRKLKGSEWTPEFAETVYKDVEKHKYFITNLGKCTQLDARPLPDKIFHQYIELLKTEFNLIKPKVIILFGNQVSSIVLDEKISVSEVRKQEFIRNFNGEEFKLYSVYYPVGNGFMNVDKSIEDIKWIQENISKE